MPHQRDTPTKAPNQSNLRLVRTLSEEDGIGGGCLGFVGRTSYAMTPNGWLIVASPEECRLKVFDARGMFVRSIVCRKDDYDAPLHPDIVALGPQNNAIVVDKRSGIIGVFGISGKFIRKFGVKKNGKQGDIDDSSDFLRPASKNIVKKNGKQGDIDDIHVTSQGNMIVVLKFNYVDRGIIVLDSLGVCLGEIELDYGVQWFFSNDRMLTSSGCLYDFTKMNTKKFQPVMLEGNNTYDDRIVGFAADDDGNAYVRVKMDSGCGFKTSILTQKLDVLGNPVEMGGIKVFNTSGKMIKVIKGCPITTSRIIHMAVLANKHIAISGERSTSIGDYAIRGIQKEGYDAIYGERITSIWDGKKFHDFAGDLLAVVGGKAVVGKIFNTYHEYSLWSISGSMLDFQKITMPETIQTLFRVYSLSCIPIVVDATDRIILGDHGCVRILNPDCSVKKIITDADGQGCMFDKITAVTTDKKNRIIVADHYYEERRIEIGRSDKHVRMFNANGKFLESNTDDEFRANGHTRIADMFKDPYTMAYDSHDRAVVVVWGYDRRIEIRDTSGNAMKEISVDGGHGESIDFVHALTVDKWDRIITVEPHLLTIRIFDHMGNPIKTVRGTSIGGKNLRRICGIASDSTGRIIISGYDENGVALIQIFGPSNKPRTKSRRDKQLTAKRGMDPLHILKVRYAKGEITNEQFDDMKKRLA